MISVIIVAAVFFGGMVCFGLGSPAAFGPPVRHLPAYPRVAPLHCGYHNTRISVTRRRLSRDFSIWCQVARPDRPRTGVVAHLR